MWTPRSLTIPSSEDRGTLARAPTQFNPEGRHPPGERSDKKDQKEERPRKILYGRVQLRPWPGHCTLLIQAEDWRISHLYSPDLRHPGTGLLCQSDGERTHLSNRESPPKSLSLSHSVPGGTGGGPIKPDRPQGQKAIGPRGSRRHLLRPRCLHRGSLCSCGSRWTTFFPLSFGIITPASWPLALDGRTPIAAMWLRTAVRLATPALSASVAAFHPKLILPPPRSEQPGHWPATWRQQGGTSDNEPRQTDHTSRFQ